MDQGKRIRAWLGRHLMVLKLQKSNGRASLNEADALIKEIKRSKRNIQSTVEEIVEQTEELKDLASDPGNFDS